MSSFLTQKNPIQHWIDTPDGSYTGKPNYGNNFYEVLFKNKNNISLIIPIIANKLLRDLGEDEASKIDTISLVKDRHDRIRIVIIAFVDNELRALT